MQNRRVISLWFPNLAAERVLRTRHVDAPFAIVHTQQNAQVLASLCPQAHAFGLFEGQSIFDARALCKGLITQANDPLAEVQFLTRLHRWAGKFTPWVAMHKPASLMMDISGCAHLFGGEQALADIISEDCARLRLSVQIGIADTVGAAWALARFAGQCSGPMRSGDAIDQEARATRSRAKKRRGWERGGAVQLKVGHSATHYISSIGQAFESIKELPLQALRLPPEVPTKLARLGLRRVGDLAALPRASVARRFGADTLLRLDQAFGAQPEPVCPAEPVRNFATRLSLPDPIGLAIDIEAGISRITPPLCAKLRHAGLGARSLDLALYRTDHTVQLIQVNLARPANDPDRILPLLTQNVPKIEPGFGIDMIRLEAIKVEPLRDLQHAGHAAALAAAQSRDGSDHSDLLGRLGARIGLEALRILHPCASHLPDNTQKSMSAAFNNPAEDWAAPNFKRPIIMYPPEAINTIQDGRPPLEFQWRRRVLKVMSYAGPERISPSWWLDLPSWRTGTRDYWTVTTDAGAKLWLYQAHGGAQTGGWFCHGEFG
jgi:protein ImuB